MRTIAAPCLLRLDNLGAVKAVIPMRWINVRDLPSMNQKMRKTA